MALISQRAYAKHRGVSHTAVAKAIESGRIEAEPGGKIDPEKADQQWNDNTDARRGAATAAGSAALSLQRARAMREELAAKREQLELAAVAGDLVSVADAERLWSESVLRARVRIESVASLYLDRVIVTRTKSAARKFLDELLGTFFDEIASAGAGDKADGSAGKLRKQRRK